MVIKKYLSKEEYKEYTDLKKQLQTRRSKQELKSLREREESEERESRYGKTRSGKLGKLIVRGVGVARKGVARSLYTRGRSSDGVKKGRGRPRGSVKYVDPRTGQPIGVYEYRKILSARLRREKLESLRKFRVNPRQEAVLQRVERRRAYQRLNPESKIIPDTHGDIYLNNIFKEIEDSSNLVA